MLSGTRPSTKRMLALSLLWFSLISLLIVFRYTTVDKSYHVPVNVSGVSGVESIVADVHPKNPEIGQKSVWRSPVVFIDGVDAETLQVILLLPWKPLNAIKFNVISHLLWSDCLGSFAQHYSGLMYFKKSCYCYHLVYLISLSQSQSDHIKRL